MNDARIIEHSMENLKEGLLMKAKVYLDQNDLKRSQKCVRMHGHLVHSEVQEKMTRLTERGANPFDGLDDEPVS